MSGEEKITTDMIKQYMKLETEIQALEKKNVRKSYKAVKHQIDDITQTIETLEKEVRSKKDELDKEKGKRKGKGNSGAESVQLVLANKKGDEDISKEQANYLEAMSSLEVIMKQLEGVKKQKEDLLVVMKDKAPEVEQLDKLEKEQDELLSSIFKGDYGSDLENKLEAEFDLYQEKRQRIDTANYKWNNGRNLLMHAIKQMTEAEKYWIEASKIPIIQNAEKYRLATITRNNLIAAIQNVRNCQRYLDNIKFPYCNEDEINTLDKAVRNVYIDMQTSDRTDYALRCFNTTRRRACALDQWFDNVIKTVIQKDLKEAKKLEKESGNALREERLRLMKQKLLERGENVEDLPVKAGDYEDDEEPELMKLADVQVVETEQNKDQTLTPGDENCIPAPTPVPLRELAPPPSQEMVFGNIEQLKKQHEKETADFDKAQEMNKARLQQGLEEKLAARRNRRNRQTAVQ